VNLETSRNLTFILGTSLFQCLAIRFLILKESYFTVEEQVIFNLVPDDVVW